VSDSLSIVVGVPANAQIRRRGFAATSGRASPLPPEERRAMLVAATLPLLAQRGPKVTTKQIATAAGVAEGTIFRVFKDKEELINAAVQQALDPEVTLAELAAVDITLPLDTRVVEISRVMQRRLTLVFNIMIAMRMSGPPRGNPPSAPSGPPPGAKQATEKIFTEMVRLLEPDRERLRRPVEEVAHILRLLTFSGSHPFIADGNLLSAEEIATTVLDGVRRRPGHGQDLEPPTRGGHRC
jgi:AcrR family transcriptional regulator